MRRPRRLGLSLAALLGLGLSGLLLHGGGAGVSATPAFGRLLRLTGPLRGLPVPFLWSAWGEAQRRHDTAAAASVGRYLTWLLPEREDLFAGFASELAYGSAAMATAPEEQARLLLDALRLLDEGQELHPGSARFAVEANFILLDRCLAPERSSLRQAFEELTRTSVLELAASYARHATTLAPGLDLPRLRRAMTAEERGLEAVLAQDLAGAAGLFLEAARSWRPLAPERAAWLAALARDLPGGLENLPPELRKWLTGDHRLGRKPELWSR